MICTKENYINNDVCTYFLGNIIQVGKSDIGIMNKPFSYLNFLVDLKSSYPLVPELQQAKK